MKISGGDWTCCGGKWERMRGSGGRSIWYGGREWEEGEEKSKNLHILSSFLVGHRLFNFKVVQKTT